MKFSALILAMIILVASVYPVSPKLMSSITAMSDCCLSKKHCDKKDHAAGKNNECPNGACNPFSICNCFPAVVAKYPALSHTLYPLSRARQFLFDENIYFNYHADCWHPPKTA